MYIYIYIYIYVVVFVHVYICICLYTLCTHIYLFFHISYWAVTVSLPIIHQGYRSSACHPRVSAWPPLRTARNQHLFAARNSRGVVLKWLEFIYIYIYTSPFYHIVDYTHHDHITIIFCSMYIYSHPGLDRIWNFQRSLLKMIFENHHILSTSGWLYI